MSKYDYKQLYKRFEKNIQTKEDFIKFEELVDQATPPTAEEIVKDFNLNALAVAVHLGDIGAASFPIMGNKDFKIYELEQFKSVVTYIKKLELDGVDALKENMKLEDKLSNIKKDGIIFSGLVMNDIQFRFNNRNGMKATIVNEKIVITLHNSRVVTISHFRYNPSYVSLVFDYNYSIDHMVRVNRDLKDLQVFINEENKGFLGYIKNKMSEVKR